MKTLYSLLGITLISSVALTSCKDDEIPSGGGNKEEVAPYTVSATVTDFVASEVAPASMSRANAETNGAINWTEGDKFLMWNKRNSGAYEFTLAEGSDITSKTVSFTGEAAVSNEDVLLGFYPKKDFVVAEDGIQFALPASATQTAGQPELQQSLLMAATATMTDGQISEFVFKPVVSLFNFNISNNTTYSSLKIKSVEVTSDKDIFPTVVAVNQNAETFKLAGKLNSLELLMNEQELAQGSTVDGMMCVLPSDKDIEDSELMVTVETVNGETPVIFEFALPVQDLTNGTKKFEEGKVYKFGLELNETVEVPEDGYKETEEGDWFVYTADGLVKWMSEGDKTKNLTLMKDMDMTEKAWTSVTEFSGVLDGKGHTISNLNITADGTNAGLVANNKGTIQNLTLKNVTASGTTVGAVAAENNGTISNCHVVGGTLSGTGTSKTGGLTGYNKANIINSSVSKVNVNAGASTDTNVGGLVGKSEGSSNIQGSSVDPETVVTVSGTGTTNRIGGFVGSHWEGKIYGCYSNAKVDAKVASEAGGFAGLLQSPKDKNIEVCYSTGTISSVGGNAGGFVGKIHNSNGSIKSCYSISKLTASGTVNGFAGSKAGDNNPTISNCYTTNNVNNSVGEKVESIEDLRSKAEAMNSAASESGFMFEVGETDEEPLVIVKKEVNE